MTSVLEMPRHLVVKKQTKPGRIELTEKGLCLLGRWNNHRVAEQLTKDPTTWSLDKLAYLVYGATCQSHRNKIKKRLAGLRRYMLLALETPFVTFYGDHGTIKGIRLYNHQVEDDRIALGIELRKAKAAGEISVQRFDALNEQLLLPFL